MFQQGRYNYRSAGWLLESGISVGTSFHGAIAADWTHRKENISNYVCVNVLSHHHLCTLQDYDHPYGQWHHKQGPQQLYIVMPSQHLTHEAELPIRQV